MNCRSKIFVVLSFIIPTSGNGSKENRRHFKRKAIVFSGNLSLVNIVTYCCAQLGEVVTGMNFLNGICQAKMKNCVL